jgi:thiol-disulfide isomerase/thioredoxin
MIGTSVSEAYGNQTKEEYIGKYSNHLKKLDQYVQRLPTVEDFPPNHEWLNTIDGKPLSFNKELKDKIVVVDFWSSCCINCIHVLEEMNYLEETFKDRKEIAFVGCHSAKFDNEKDLHMLKQAVIRYNIKHPVLNDSKFIFWQS